ncbi:hypothetical protein AMATHDRAFT_72708 [Amanita thiersii Skay4041]|uniref:precorrin-2 dehydrogenase n=1 Tax=Amanita thiersii Skay4041 TaxID=703135 RepID=A0A2A9NVN5_9AGAR|nr:hypothetical protein AMATHDRAFT_72708 [Amanita thiersii Skay4041]
MAAHSPSLLIAWQLNNKNVLIVGGGEIASQRIDSILSTPASITLVAPLDGLSIRTTEHIVSHPDRITYHNRLFSGPDELENIDMVLTALDDSDRTREIVNMCRAARIPVNAADIPDLCDFYFGAQIRDGPLQIMISTNGNGPRLASLIKSKVQKNLNGTEGKAILKVGTLRSMLKGRAPGVGGDVGRRRMKWMAELCNTWEMEELALLDEGMMVKLLDQGWEKDCVPTPEEIDRSLKRQGQSQQILIPSIIGIVSGALFVTCLVVARRR